MAPRYTVIFEKEAEGGYHVFCPTLPECHTQSETMEEDVENIREAIGLYIESLVEDSLPIPTEDILTNRLRFRLDTKATHCHRERLGSSYRAIGLRVSPTARQPRDLCALERPGSRGDSDAQGRTEAKEYCARSSRI